MKWGFRKSRGDRAASLLHRAIVEAVIYFKREGIPKSPSVAHQKRKPTRVRIAPRAFWEIRADGV